MTLTSSGSEGLGANSHRSPHVYPLQGTQPTMVALDGSRQGPHAPPPTARWGRRCRQKPAPGGSLPTVPAVPAPSTLPAWVARGPLPLLLPVAPTDLPRIVPTGTGVR